MACVLGSSIPRKAFWNMISRRFVKGVGGLTRDCIALSKGVGILVERLAAIKWILEWVKRLLVFD